MMQSLGLHAIPDGDAGIYATLRVMADLARRDSLDAVVRRTTAEIVREIPRDHGLLHAQLIRRWIGPRTYFLADPTYAEALHTPAWQMRQILTRGTLGVDCDDIALLGAAMGLSVGLKARFSVVAFGSPSSPFRHVWVELSALHPTRWVVIDPTRPLQQLPAQISRVRYWEV